MNELYYNPTVNVIYGKVLLKLLNFYFYKFDFPLQVSSKSWHRQNKRSFNKAPSEYFFLVCLGGDLLLFGMGTLRASALGAGEGDVMVPARCELAVRCGALLPRREKGRHQPEGAATRTTAALQRLPSLHGAYICK